LCSESMSYAEIHLDNLNKNIQAVRAAITPGTKICAMLKANAYGHGQTQIARQCGKAGVEYIGVATPFEGCEVRKAGIELPIIVFDAILKENIHVVIKYGLTQTVFSLEILEELQQQAAKAGIKIPVHVQYDTGFSRVGIQEGELAELLRAFSKYGNIAFEGFYTHFTASGASDKTEAYRQMERFQKALKKVREAGFAPIAHASNSGGILGLEQCGLDMVRPGIMLYGYYPSEHVRGNVPLYPVLQWKTHIVQVKTVAPNTGVGYDGTFITRRITRIATLPVGYGDGLKRLIGNTGCVLIGGQRAPVIGTVCMDLCMADITDIDNAKEGDEAVLLGSQGCEEIDADEMARWAKTISYEILSSLSPRVQRLYI
jgi:alanine racemase